MSFILKKSGFLLVVMSGLFTILFGYQNCGKVSFDRQQKPGVTCVTGVLDTAGVCCAQAEVTAGTCGTSCVWVGDKNVLASPTSFTGTGTVSGIVNFTIPNNVDEIENVSFNFNDGSEILIVEGANQVVSHTFTSNTTKTFNVTLAVKKINESCTHSQTIIITINTTDTCLIATDLSGDNRGVVGESLDFLVSMTSCPNNGYSIDWHKNYNQDMIIDQTVVNNPEVSFIYAQPGTYRVRANTKYPSLAVSAISEKDVIITCPLGSYQNSANACICYSNNLPLPGNGICTPCGVGATPDPTTGACLCAAGQTYDPVDQRCECPSGNPPVGGSCTPAPTSCSIVVNGSKIIKQEGEVLTLHKRDNVGAVSCGFTCSSQSRTCRSGQFVNASNVPTPFDPSYTYLDSPSCISTCSSCSLPVADGVLTATQGETRTVFRRQSGAVSCGFTCSAETLSCNATQFVNGALKPVTDGSALYITQPPCISACQSCPVTGYPGVTSLNVGQSLTKYTTSGVACGGKSCASQTRTCTVAGTALSFDAIYTFTDANSCQSAIPVCAPQACPVTGYLGQLSLAAGQTLIGITATNATCGGACLTVSRSCPPTGGVTVAFPANTFPPTSTTVCASTVPACPSQNPDIIFSSVENGFSKELFNYNSEQIYGRILNAFVNSTACTAADAADPSHPAQDTSFTGCPDSAYVPINTHAYSNGTKHWAFAANIWKTSPHNGNNLYGHELFIPGKYRTCVKNPDGKRDCADTEIVGSEPEIIFSETEQGADQSNFDYATDRLYIRVNKLAPTVRDYRGLANTKGCVAVDATDPTHPSQDLTYCDVASPSQAYTSSRYLDLPKSDWSCGETGENRGKCQFLGFDRINGGGLTHTLSQNAKAVPGRYKLCIYNKFSNQNTCKQITITGSSTPINPITCTSGQFLETHRDTGEQFCARLGSVDGQFCSGGSSNMWTDYSSRSNRPSSQLTCSLPVNSSYADRWWIPQDGQGSMYHRNIGRCSGSAACAIYANIDVYRASNNTFVYTRNVTTAADVQKYLGGTKCSSAQSAFTCAPSATCPDCAANETWDRTQCRCVGGDGVVNPINPINPVAPEPLLRGCFIDTHKWDVSHNGENCLADIGSCTGTNYIIFSIGDKRTPYGSLGQTGDRFELTDPSKYSVTWTGACVGTGALCSVVKTGNGIFTSTATIRRLSDNQTWTRTINANKNTQLFINPLDCPDLP